MAETREKLVYLAKLSQSAERYEEMLDYMHSVVKNSDGELSVEERQLVKIAYSNVLGSRKATRQLLSAVEVKEESNTVLVRDYVGIVEAELSEICGSLIKSLEEGSNEFYIQFKEEYCSDWPRIEGSTISVDNMTKEQLLFVAKLGKSAKRYRDVLHYMHLVVKNSDGDITAEEEKLITAAYTKMRGSLMAVQDKLLAMMEIEEPSKKLFIEEYMAKLDEMITSVYSKMVDILKCIIPIPVNNSTKMKKLGKDWPRFTVQQGPLLGWFFSSHIYKPSVIKSLISSKMLFGTPLKKFSNFLEARSDNLQERARDELMDAFNDNFSVFCSALSQLKVLHPKLSRTQRSIKLRRRSLLWRRPLKHIFIRSTGMTRYKTGEEKRREKLKVLVDHIMDWTEQLTLHGPLGIMKKASHITVKTQSDIILAGEYRGSFFTGELRINAKFHPDIIYGLIVQGLELGFPLKKLKLM